MSGAAASPAPAIATFGGCWSRPPGTTGTPVVGRSLRLRRRGQSPKAIALADRALRRLTLRQRRMLYQGKHPNLVNIAVARELAGFVWNVLHPATITA